MRNPLKILAVPGSVRASSFNRGLLVAARNIGQSEIEIEIYEGLGELPIFSQDLEGENMPARASELDRALRNADAVLIATPEYTGSIPGGLKNLLDWAARPFGNGAFQGKPTAIIGASPGQYGAARSVEMTTKIVGALGANVLERNLTVSRAMDRFDSDGTLSDEMVKRSLEDVLTGLSDLARRPVTA